MESTPSFEQLDAIERPTLWGWLDALHHRPWTDQWGREHEGHGFATGLRAALDAIVSDGPPPRELPGPPEWIRQAVRDRVVSLSSAWWQTDGFGVVRTLERLGVPVEVDDRYVLAMIGGLGARHDRMPRDAALRTDDELRSRFWRVFEVEGAGEISLANIDKFSVPQAGWHATVLRLAADGVLERERLLTSCLEALQRDFSAYRAGWFARCFRALEPTVEEAAARQEQLRSLLRSPISATVSFAVEQLRRVGRQGLLAHDPEGLRPGLHARSKAAAVGTIDLLRDTGRRRPDAIEQLAELLGEALTHEHVDVQAAAMDLLTSWDQLQVAQANAALLAPTMQQRLGIVRAPVVRSATTHASAPPPPTRQENLTERLAVVLEDDRDPDLLERTLADLALRPDAASFQPLTKRALHVLATRAPDRTRHERLRAQVARLILAGVGSPPPAPPLPLPPGRTAFLHRRIREIHDVLTGRRPPHRLLAEPTSIDGWLDPGEFAARFVASAPTPGDLVAAIHRLGTAGREEAARRITGRDEAARAVRYALGGPPERGRIRVAALWAAAAHARDGGATHPSLIKAGLDRAGQGRPIQSTFTASGHRQSTTVDGRALSYTIWDYRIDVDHAPVDASTGLTDGISSTNGFGDLIEGWLDWLVHSTPADLEPLLTEQLWPLFDFSVNHDATRLLRGIVRHRSTLGTLGAIGVARGLVSDRDEHRVLAIDAAIEHASTGTLKAPGLAAAISTLLPTEPAARWAKALRTISDAAPSGFVLDTLDEVLAHSDPSLHGLAEITRLYRDLLIHEGRRPSEAARQWAGRISGTTRLATDARGILAL